MLKLRKFVCGWFGALALMLLLIPAMTLWFVLRSNNLQGPSSPIRSYVPFLAFPLLLAVPYGMAWWTVKKRKAFARGWAIIASIELILMSVLPLIRTKLPAAYQRHSASHRTFHFGIAEGLLLAIGILGLVVFARRDAMAQALDETPKPPRITGDGTSRFLDGVAWLVGVGGYFAGRYMWFQWGKANGFTPSRESGFLLVIVAAVLITTVLHECGHAVVGMALGMKLRMFIVGPFHWRIRDGRWKFQFIPAKFLSAGGAAALVPTNPHQGHWREAWMIAAGPLTNLVVGLIATYAALMAKGQPFEQYWLFLTLISTISLVTFIVNLIPMRPEAAYSDGARIYQLLHDGPWADLHRALSIAASTTVTPLRPKDYDIDAIQRAEQSFTQGQHALVLRLLASSYFLDWGALSKASEAVVEAERICKESALDLPAELCVAFVFRTAFLRRDAAGARQWWARMEAKKLTHFGSDYWLAKSALSWVEGRNEEARQAWEKGNPLAQKLPAAGDYEFDRYRYTLLHHCIENEVVGVTTEGRFAEAAG